MYQPSLGYSVSSPVSLALTIVIPNVTPIFRCTRASGNYLTSKLLAFTKCSTQHVFNLLCSLMASMMLMTTCASMMLMNIYINNVIEYKNLFNLVNQIIVLMPYSLSISCDFKTLFTFELICSIMLDHSWKVSHHALTYLSFALHSHHARCVPLKCCNFTRTARNNTIVSWLCRMQRK